MSRKQLTQSVGKNFEGGPIFTVDKDGSIQPTATQAMSRGAPFVIRAAEGTESDPYAGYVCAWGDGACRCSALIADLGGEPHMKISADAYAIASNAPSGRYTLYATMSNTGVSPGPKTVRPPEPKTPDDPDPGTTSAPDPGTKDDPKPNATNGDIHV
jgi:hypothetical protein